MNTRMNAQQKPVVKSADRVLDLLELLASKGRALTHTEICAELGIPKSSLSQLVGNLVERGYLKYTPGPNTYTLGPSLIRLVARQRESVTLVEMAQPLTDRITRVTGESSSLNLQREDMVQRVCGANSTQQLTFSMTLDELAPMYAVSSGKVLLAALKDEEIDAYLSRTPLNPITKRTISSSAALRRELKLVRRQGVAWSVEEYTPGIIGVAVPVVDQQGKTVGALNIAFPSARDTPEHRLRLVSALQDAALSLQKDLVAAE